MGWKCSTVGRILFVKRVGKMLVGRTETQKGVKGKSKGKISIKTYGGVEV
jgi:hypothetical protein